jgi:hypothetical protein
MLNKTDFTALELVRTIANELVSVRNRANPYISRAKRASLSDVQSEVQLLFNKSSEK